MHNTHLLIQEDLKTQITGNLIKFAQCFKSESHRIQLASRHALKRVENFLSLLKNLTKTRQQIID